MLSINFSYVFIIFSILFIQMICDATNINKMLSTFFYTILPIISTMVILYDTQDAIILGCIGVFAILFYTLQDSTADGHLSYSNSNSKKSYDIKKLKVFAKKYDIPISTAERMIKYSYKFNKEESDNMYICSCMRNGCKYYYIRNCNNGTIVLFDKIKIKIEIEPIKNTVCDLQDKLSEMLKNHKEDKQLEKIKKILNGDNNVEKIKENIKILEEFVDIFKDYQFNPNEKSEMKLKKFIELAIKVIDVSNNQVHTIENPNKTEQVVNTVVEVENDNMNVINDTNNKTDPLPNVEFANNMA